MYKRFIKIILLFALVSSLGACTQFDQRVAGYGTGGAAFGALAGGAITGTGRGALAGAAIGAAAGIAAGADGGEAPRYRKTYYRDDSELCTYRDAYNRLYQAPCR